MAIAVRGLQVALAMVLIGPWEAAGQSFRRAGTEFNAVRTVHVPPGKPYSIVVTQFFHHGQIDAQGRNMAVATAKGQKLVPVRPLQVGPGDFCRLAFQTMAGQGIYEIYYGGPAPARDALPAWTSQDGLLLETRHYKNCNLNSLDSVREAFLAAPPIGADYVDTVQHAENPFALAPAPFMSRYSGQLRISAPGTYRFFTSSQDCSFLLIDGKPVVAAPGMHGPTHNAYRARRQDVVLSAGTHKFEYYHAASGPNAVMVAAWQVHPAGPDPKPVAIPAEAFGAQMVGRALAGPPTTRTEKALPDFLLEIAGSVPLPDHDLPLVGVRFLDMSARGLAASGKLQWDFGDGQTSEQSNPEHVYLHPGLYAVKLSIRRGTRVSEIVHRVYVDQPPVRDSAKLHKLDDYLRIVERYDPARLDAVGLRQLVLAYLAKAESLLAWEEKAHSEGAVQEPSPPGRPDQHASQAEARKAEAQKYFAAAVAAGKVALLGDSAAKGDDELVRLARLVGPLARDRLGDSLLAGSIWLGASKRLTAAGPKGECLIHAADIALNDVATPEAIQAARNYLQMATKLCPPGPGPLSSRLKRVWGDYYASTGDGQSARKAYAEAETLLDSRRPYVERAAWQGAHGRSTEQFLKSGELDRAIAQIHQWQDEFPADKVHGYVTLLAARYWAQRGKYPQAIALSRQLAATNSDSAYVDQALLLAAECHEAAGETDKAVATLQALLKEHPGSPLVPEVKQRIKRLQAGPAGGARGRGEPGG